MFKSFYELLSDSGKKEIDYEQRPEGLGGLYTASFETGGYRYEIEDRIEDRGDISCIKISRKIKGTALSGKNEQLDGIRFAVSLAVNCPHGSKWRFCSPTIDLTKPRKNIYKQQKYDQNEASIGNIFGAYNCSDHIMYSIYRCANADNEKRVVKEFTLKQKLQQRHEEDMAALGYEVTGKDHLELMISWPMTTGFYQMDGKDINVSLEYKLIRDESPTFADGVYAAYKNLVNEVINMTRGPLRRERLGDLEKTKKRLEGLYHEPEGEKPEYFSLNDDFIGYGMEERNLMMALFMAIHAGGKWLGVMERIGDFYVNHCVTTDGFAWTRFDLKKMEPVSDFDGNYVLAMSQAMVDFFLAYKDMKRRGINKPSWLESTRRFADYLVRIQNADGSWYHAYDVSGREANAPNRDKVRAGVKEISRKTGTEVPLYLLSRLTMYLEENGLTADDYRAASIKCADFVLKNMVRFEMYLGADPSHPSEPNKDAVKYTLMGLYSAYRMCGKKEYLDGAVTAAKLFVVWNNKDYPCECPELYKLGLETGEELFVVDTRYAYMDFDIEDL